MVAKDILTLSEQIGESILLFTMKGVQVGFYKEFISKSIKLIDEQKSYLPVWVESLEEKEAKMILNKILEGPMPVTKAEINQNASVAIHSLILLTQPLMEFHSRYIVFSFELSRLQREILAKYPNEPFYSEADKFLQ